MIGDKAIDLKRTPVVRYEIIERQGKVFLRASVYGDGIRHYHEILLREYHPISELPSMMQIAKQGLAQHVGRHIVYGDV